MSERMTDAEWEADYWAKVNAENLERWLAEVEETTDA